jgi:uncharacterized metal-binding protein YceD (DUF177 family)
LKLSIWLSLVVLVVAEIILLELPVVVVVLEDCSLTLARQKSNLTRM